jgi:dGTPase
MLLSAGMANANYEQLLSPARLRETTDKSRDRNLEVFSDKGRIVRSAPFRRLQSKAQVFSMARTGAVRTRLTHSLEVANYGEFIAEILAQRLVVRKRLSADLRLPFVQTVENACLLHDIGNPPFGHMGEYAIGRWFSANKKMLTKHWTGPNRISPADAERYLTAYANFDGNPHGFRIITRLQWLSDEYGMNLSCSLLASYLKYLGTRPEKGKRFRKKIGYFPSEEGVVKSVWQRIGLNTDDAGLPTQRHPLAFVMEAADDIAYCFSDIEDAIEKHVVSEDEFFSWMKSKGANLNKWVRQAKRQKYMMAQGAFHLFRLGISKYLVESAVKAYLKNEGSILDGSMDKSLFDTDTKSKRWLDLLREFSSAKVYTSREAIDTELVGLNAITGLLDEYKPMMLLTTRQFEELSDKNNRDRLSRFPILSLLFCLLPAKHLLWYMWSKDTTPKLEPIHRTQLVVDYVAGMTDSHVLKIFNMMNGAQQFGVE